MRKISDIKHMLPLRKALFEMSTKGFKNDSLGGRNTEITTNIFSHKCI